MFTVFGILTETPGSQVTLENFKLVEGEVSKSSCLLTREREFGDLGLVSFPSFFPGDGRATLAGPGYTQLIFIKHLRSLPGTGLGISRMVPHLVCT